MATELGTLRSRKDEIDLNQEYTPNKKQRESRRKVWTRYQAMSSNQFRKEAEIEWDHADKNFRQWSPPRQIGDWRADLTLPDAFAGVQAQMQETIDRKSRPRLIRVEDSDMGKEEFANSIINFSMDRTDFDYTYFQAKYSAAIRGTAILMEIYRVDKRDIQDITGVDEKGALTYTKKEVIDYDDAYTMQIPNEYFYIDERCLHMNDAIDAIHREVIDIDEFHRKYKFRPDFFDINKVKSGTDTGKKGFFELAKDMEGHQVEALHYFNRATDEYVVLANNVIVRQGPIPYKHKELPFAVVYQYYIPGRFWGMGIPKVIESLTDERSTLRRLNIDRQKMQMNKMVFVNDAISLDEEELVTRPFGIVNVPAGGMPLNQAIMPFEYGDTPQSYYKTEEIILEDIRRAHGIDDRVQGVNVGGTATEAAILKESSSRRINMIAQLVEMDTMRRIGKLKWSNIQFFYKAPKIEKITRKNKDVEKKTYKKISVKGRQFEIEKNEQGHRTLKMSDFDGTSSFELNKSFASFMEGDMDITVQSEAHAILSKPLQQAKVTEMFNMLTGNQLTAAEVDPRKAVQRYLEVNEESPRHWMRDSSMPDADFEMLAERENYVMSQGVPLDPTPDANEAHTLVHLNFMDSEAYNRLPPAVQDMIEYHVLGEHQNNPRTGSLDELGGGEAAPGAAGVPEAIPPQIQPADLQPSNVTSSNG